MAEELVAAPDEGACAGVGEELLLEGVGGDDGDGGGAWEVVEQVLDLAQLELGAVLDLGLLHEEVVFLKPWSALDIVREGLACRSGRNDRHSGRRANAPSLQR